MKIDDVATRLEALGNPTRLKIYRALVRAGESGLAVGRLQEKLKIASSTHGVARRRTSSRRSVDF
jgi:DNA-binding transcriptional ArsR family regulator